MNVAVTRRPWEAGRLWHQLRATTQHGLAVGALQSIETNTERIVSANVEFVVRILANLSRKENARKQQGKTAPANPFLPYETDLYVTDLSETHLCLLNKFNVVDHHFLIVTRQFEPQENWLTLADFEALVRCLQEVDGLAFFNSSKQAGASQPHKHLQVVPYSESLRCFPMEPVITQAIGQAQAKTSPQASDQRTHADNKPHLATFSDQLPFCHAIASVTDTSVTDTSVTDASVTGPLAQTAPPTLRATHYLSGYHTLLSAIAPSTTAKSKNHHWQGKQSFAYNLLCTRHWMMAVPRSQEKHANISVNSLGFAGSLLVKNAETLKKLKDISPIKLLQHVSYPPTRS
ncbi:MAG: DUF4922 domain-containing protein [Cyanobacteria bacterium J06597_16]